MTPPPLSEIFRKFIAFGKSRLPLDESRPGWILQDQSKFYPPLLFLQTLLSFTLLVNFFIIVGIHTCRQATLCSSSSRFLALSLLSCTNCIGDKNTSHQCSFLVPLLRLISPDILLCPPQDTKIPRDHHDHQDYCHHHNHHNQNNDDDDERGVIETQVEIAIGQPWNQSKQQSCRPS